MASTESGPVTTALTIGTFDPGTLGHAFLFRRCERLADQVIVGVNSDRFVTEYKGPPRWSETERMAVIASLGFDVRLNDGPGIDLIREVDPDFLVIGSDWLRRDYLAQIGCDAQLFEDMDITLVYVPRIPAISSTEVKAR